MPMQVSNVKEHIDALQVCFYWCYSFVLQVRCYHRRYTEYG